MDGLGVKKDYQKALILFEQSANQNFAPAIANLGVMYRKGLGVPKDYNKALNLYRLAASMGNIGAYDNLGIMYLNAYGVERDINTAKSFFQYACNKDYILGCEHYQELNEQGY